MKDSRALRGWQNSDLSVLSSQRPALFGLAALWIMLFHSSLSFSWTPVQIIKSTGYAGVDVFFFLSGIGLYYSMDRDPQPLRFYRRRTARLLIPFLLIGLCYELPRCLLGLQTPGDILRNLSLVSFFCDGEQYYWFAAAALFFYLLYPAIHAAFRHKLYIGVALAAAFAVPFLVLANDSPLFYRISGLIFRIPVFLLGCALAPAVKRGYKLNTLPTVLSCLAIALIYWYLWIDISPWYLRMYLFIPLSVSLSLLAGVALSFLPQEGIIQRVLRFLGDITLELYLIHVRLLDFLSRAVFPNHAGSVEINGLAVLLTIPLAWGIHKLCGMICKKVL